MNTYFISDMHIGHERCINFDNRPFANVEEMDNLMHFYWNEKIKNDDVVYILGDISLKVNEDIIKFVSTLKGHKILVKGNHDKLQDHRYKILFDDIVNYAEIKVGVKNPDNSTNTLNLVLSHYPILMWKNQHRGHIHLYGHVHNSPEETIYRESLQRLIESKNIDDDSPHHRTPLKLTNNYLAYNVGAMMPYMNYTPRTLDEIIKYGNKYYKQGE